MSNLLGALNEPPFDWYYAWTALDSDGAPKTDVSDALKQPETIRVRWDMPDGTRAGGTRELSADVVPDKGIFGAEFSLIFTFPDFDRTIKSRLDNTAADYVSKLYFLMSRCMQGKALTKWNKVAGKVV